jgi:hypothetical protein
VSNNSRPVSVSPSVLSSLFLSLLYNFVSLILLYLSANRNSTYL